jgi:MFS family permease
MAAQPGHPLRPLLWAGWAATLGQGIIVPLLPVYADQLGASRLYVGCIFGAFALARTLFMPAFGRLSDGYGRKPFITAGLSLYVGASPALVSLTQVVSLLLIRFMQGIAAAMILPIVLAYAGDLAPAGSEGHTMGKFNAALALGLSGGPIIGGMSADVFGLDAAFVGMGLVSFAGCLIAILFLPPTAEEKGRRSCRRGREVTTPSVMTRSNSRELGKLWSYRFTYSMCIGTVWCFAPLMAATLFGLSSFAIGAMITAGMMVTTVMAPFAGIWADRISKRFLIVGGGLTASMGMLVLACLAQSWKFYLASILLGIAGGLSAPAVTALAVIIGHRGHDLGRTMAVLGTAESSGMVCGPFLAGLVADVWGLQIALWGAALLALMATLPVLFLAPEPEIGVP